MANNVWSGSIEIAPYIKIGDDFLEMLKEDEQEVLIHYRIERSKYYPAVMYLSNGDPGYPAEGGEIEYMEVTNNDGDEINPDEMYVKTISYVPNRSAKFVTLYDYLDDHVSMDEPPDEDD